MAHGALIGILTIQMAIAGPPTWWSARGVQTGQPIDFAAANIGQLKNIARKAYDELLTALPAEAWTTPKGQALKTLIASWYTDPAMTIPKPGADFAMLNQGQLKHVAKHFYDVFGEQGIDVSSIVGDLTGQRIYPWSDTTVDDSNFSPASMGQLKWVFSFGLDADNDHLSDWWELAIVNARGDDDIVSIDQVNPNDDFDGDGLTNAEECEAHTDPTRYTKDLPPDGLKLWLKADAGITQASNGTVASWADQSPSHFLFTSPSSGRNPAIRKNTLNAVPTLKFDGVDDMLETPALGGIANTFTVFVVARNDTTHQVDAVAATGTAGTSGQRFVLFPTSGGANAGAGVSLGTNGISAYECGTSYCPARAVYTSTTIPVPTYKVIELAYADRVPSLTLNGASVATGTVSPKNTVFLGRHLGGVGAAQNYGYFNGELGEVIAYDRALTPIERKIVRSYLATRWVDTDGDNLPNGWEAEQEFNPNNPYSADAAGTLNDGAYDSDGDGLSNRREFELGSDPHDPASGLNKAMAGFWKCDEGSGTFLADSSGKDNHGTLQAAAGGGWAPSSENTMDRTAALRLNGSSQTVLVSSAHDEALDFGQVGAGSSFTLAYWFKTASTGNQRVISKGDYLSSAGFFSGIGYLAPGCVTFGVGSGTASSSLYFATDSAGQKFNDGVWHHVVIVFDRATQKVSIYVDDVLRTLKKVTGSGGTLADSNRSMSFSALANLNAASAEQLILGSRSNVDEFFSGALDDIRIYTTALQSAEIDKLVRGVDADLDQMPNWWETRYGLNPNDPSDPTIDSDVDGVSNLAEFRAGTDPAETLAPEIAPPSGLYPIQFPVTITSAPGTVVRYTTNGAAPTETSPIYVAGNPPIIDRTMTFTARAFSADKAPSRSVSANYTLTGVLAAGADHIIVQRVDGTLVGWGSNGSDRLSATIDSSSAPIPTVLTDRNGYVIRSLSAGDDFSVAALADGSVVAWGANRYGSSGSPRPSGGLAPYIYVTDALLGGKLSGISAVSVGATFTTALGSNGQVWTWGANTGGQLGSDTAVDTDEVLHSRARLVLKREGTETTSTTLTNIGKVSAGGGFGLALGKEGKVWSWGSNAYGQLGQTLSPASAPYRLSARLIPSTAFGSRPVLDVIGGRYSAFAITAASTTNRDPAKNLLYAWGRNDSRQSGSSSSAGSLTAPTQVVYKVGTVLKPFEGVVAVAAGSSHTVALRYDGTVWAWGNTNRTRVGYLQPGEDTERENPLPVMLNAQEPLNEVIAIETGDDFSVALKRDGSVIVWGDNETVSRHGNGVTWNENTVGDFTWHRIIDPAESVDSDRDGYSDAYELVNGSDRLNNNPSLDDTPAPTFVVDANGEADFSTIQDAIDAVTTDYAIIMVKPGTYFGSIAASGHKMLIKSTDGASQTIIDARKDSAGVYLNSDCTIDGFTIKNAFGDTNGVTHNGGGIFVDQCHPYITRCLIVANRAKDGAAVYNNFGMPTFTYCTLAFNEAVYGAAPGESGPAVYADGFRARFYNCILKNPRTIGEVGGKGAYVFNSFLWNKTGPILAKDNIAPTTDAIQIGLLESGHLTATSVMVNRPGAIRNPADLSVPVSPDIEQEVDASNPDIGADEYKDTDNDNIPDWWEKLHNEDLESDPAVADSGKHVPADDPETNLQKYTAEINEDLIEDVVGEVPATVHYDVDDKNGLGLDADGSGMVALGQWTLNTTTVNGRSGSNYLVSSGGAGEVAFVPNLPSDGSYEVNLWWPWGDYNPKTVVEIRSDAGKTLASFTIDQRKQSNRWKSVGVFSFRKGTSARVVIKVPANSTKPVVADAVSFVPVEPAVQVRGYSTNIDGSTFTASKSGTASAWGVRQLATVSGVTTSTVRISKKPAATFTFFPNVRTEGNYRVLLRWQKLGGSYKNSNKALIEINHSGIPWTGTVDQTQHLGEWVLLREQPFAFPADMNSPKAPKIKITVPSETPGGGTGQWNGGYVTADAVRLEKVCTDAVIADDADRGGMYPLIGKWVSKAETSLAATGFNRGYSALTKIQGEADQFEYEKKVPAPGNYGVFVYGPSSSTFASQAIVNVNGREFSYNQRVGGKQWRPLGEIRIHGEVANIQIRRGSGSGTLTADAVALIRDPDSDHDGLMDDWEVRYGMNPDNPDEDYNQQIDGLDNFDGDDFLNGEEQLAGTDPQDFFNDASAFNFTKVATGSGDRQTGLPDSILPLPLRVRVTSSTSNLPLVNAPVTFSVPTGSSSRDSARLALSPDWSFTDSGETELHVRTDNEGYAEAYVRLPKEGWRNPDRLASDIVISAKARNSELKFTAGIKGIAGLWHLDEQQNDIAYDDSPFGSHGTLSAAGVTWRVPSTEIWRKALYFNGTGGKLAIGNSAYTALPQSSGVAGQGYQDYSVGFWFIPDSVSAAPQTVFSHAVGGEYIAAGPVVDAADSSKMRILLSRPDSAEPNDTLLSTVAVPKNQWCHVLIASRGNQVVLYLNGIAAGNLTLGLPASSADLQWGGSVPGWNKFAGMIDELVVYRGALDQGEAIQLSSTDSDWDGLPNSWEAQYGLDPFDAGDAWEDPDEDGISNYGEYLLGTSPHNKTTVAGVQDGNTDLDGDGMLDGWEANNALRPHEYDAYEDPDGDLYPNIFEFRNSTNPNDAASIPSPSIVVEKYKAIETIGAGIAALTDNYQIIKVQPGIYYENVVVPPGTKPFLLIGEGGARQCRIDAADSGSVFTVAEGVTCALAGFDLAKGNATTAAVVADRVGGGLRVKGSIASPTNVYLTSCMIRENQASGGGAAVWAQGKAMVYIFQSTVAKNGAATGTNPSAIGSPASATAGVATIKLENTISWNTSTSTLTTTQEISPGAAQLVVNRSCVRGWSIGTELVSTDPLLTPDGHLTAASPCRSKGSIYAVPVEDWDQELRDDGSPDLGVDEFIDFDGDQMADYWEEQYHLDPQDGTDAEWNSDEDTQDHSNLYAYEHGESPWGELDPFDPANREVSDDPPSGVRIPGQTSGQLTVGADGSATYTVPLFIPKGTGGMEPKLSLAYSSKAGNGPLGLGWSLAGLSTVTRGPSTIAQDGEVKGVTYTAGDQYYLDGARLIRLTGIQGGTGSTYETEVRNFAKITLKDNNVWEMKTKSGLTMSLEPVLMAGTNPIVWGVKKVTDHNGNYFTVSYLSSGEPDEINYTGNGTSLAPYNKVKFVYQTDRPDKSFNYVAGTRLWRDKLIDRIDMYSQGTIARTYQLRYLSSGSTNRSRLVRIMELGTPEMTVAADGTATFSGDRHRYADLIFEWQGWRASDRGWRSVPSWANYLPRALSEKIDSRGVIFMDVNGDGFPDMIWNRDRHDQVVDQGAYINPGRAGAPWGWAPQYTPPYPLVAEGGSDTGARLVDINGDGFQDLIAKGEYYVYDTESDDDDDDAPKLKQRDGGVWSLVPGRGWIWKTNSLPIRITNISNGKVDDERAIHFSDLNGDGKPEALVANVGSSPDTQIAEFSGFTLKARPTSGFSGLLVGVNNGFADLTGDGLPDMIYNRKNDLHNGYYSWARSSSGSWSATKLTLANLPTPDGESTFRDAGARILDLNGDGHPDFWFARKGAPATRIARLSNGDPSNRSWVNAQGTNPNFDYSVPAGVDLSPAPGDSGDQPLDTGSRLVDLNGDGLTDLLLGLYDHNLNRCQAFLNTGTGFSESDTWQPRLFLAETADDDNGKLKNIAQGVQVVDLNADGFPDMVMSRQYSEDGPTFNYVYLNRAKPQMIVQVYTANEVSDRITYKPLTNRAVYTRGVGGTLAQYPEQDVIAPIQVVERAGHEDGIGDFTWTRYKYTGLRTNLQGRGSEGFSTVEAIDERSNISTKTTYLQKYPLSGMIDSTERLAAPSKGKKRTITLAKTTNHWESPHFDVTPSGGKTYALYFPYLQNSTVISNDLDGREISTTTSSFVYDDQKEGASFSTVFGNLQRAVVSTGSTKKTTVNYYEGDLDSQWKGRITRSQVLHEADGNGADPILRTSGFTYDAQGRVATEEPEPDVATAPTSPLTTHSYDAYGNPTTVTTTGHDLSGYTSAKVPQWATVNRTTTTFYDSKGRFATRVRNALNQEASTVTEPTLGVPVTVTDANGLTARSQKYDGFGRLIETVALNDIATTTTREYFYQPNSPDTVTRRTRYRVTTQQSKGGVKFPPSTVWYDRLGREIRKESRGADGTKVIYQDTVFEFDGRTQVQKTSTPYFANGSGDPAKWTVTTSDILDRTTIIAGPTDGANPEGTRTTFEYHASFKGYKRGVGAVYGGQTVTGTVKRSGRSNLVTTTYTNDAGQTTAVVDAGKGTMQFRYDAVGNAKETIGVDGNSIKLAYDVFGRKIRMVDKDLGGWANPSIASEVGAWSTVYNSFGEVVSEKDPKGQVNFTFRDILGRTTRQLELGISGGPVPDKETKITYDNAPRGTGGAVAKGLKSKVEGYLLTSTNPYYRETYTYDALTRLVETMAEVDVATDGARTFKSSQTYDTFGRPVQTKAPSGVITENVYDGAQDGYSSGFLLGVKRLAYQDPSGTGPIAPETFLSQVNPADVNARGQATKQILGNNNLVTLTNGFNSITGRLQTVKATVNNNDVQSNVYEYDLIGTLLSRRDALPGGKAETFTYDELNRLKTSQLGNSPAQEYLYAANGNLLKKQDINSYAYGTGTEGQAAGPHAVTSVTIGALQYEYQYDGNGNMIRGPTWSKASDGTITRANLKRSVSYWQNDKPCQIVDRDATNAVQTTLAFEYGPDAGLLKKQSTVSGTQSTTYYLGSYELEIKGSTKIQRHNFGGVVFTITTEGSTTTLKTNYVLKDHLGSTEVILDELGQVLPDGRYRFDAFGLRLPTNSTCSVTQKGFTGHEQLDEVGLIHMGGRVYDPFLGRFLSADPFIQADANSQSYNRYSYVQNNPLSLTDPTGYLSVGDFFNPLTPIKLKLEAHREIAHWLRENPAVAQVVIAVAAVVVSVVTFGAATGFVAVAELSFSQIFVGTVVAGAAGGFTQGALSTAIAGGSASDILTAGLKGAAIGALSAALSFGIGHGFGGGSIGTAFGFAEGSLGDTLVTSLAHGVAQGALSAATGGDFKDGFISGFAGAISGSIVGQIDIDGTPGIAIRTVIAAAIGGTAAELTGGSFVNGAITAAFVHLFNSEMSAAMRQSIKNSSPLFEPDELYKAQVMDNGDILLHSLAAEKSLIEAYAEWLSIDADLIRATIIHESRGFGTNYMEVDKALSWFRRGANGTYGYAQLGKNARAFAELSIDDAMTMRGSIKGAAMWLRKNTDILISHGVTSPTILQVASQYNAGRQLGLVSVYGAQVNWLVKSIKAGNYPTLNQ